MLCILKLRALTLNALNYIYMQNNHEKKYDNLKKASYY